MIAKLEFNLPEENELFRYHVDVMEYRSVINDFKQYLRNAEKSGKSPSFEEMWDVFHNLLMAINYE